MPKRHPSDPTFGVILKGLRKRAKLDQGELSRLSGLATSAISSLERGLRVPRADTVERLIRALQASAEDATLLRRAAGPERRRPRGRATEGADLAGHAGRPVAPASRDLFGRDDELADAVRSLRTARLVTLHGMGGVGKTRLAQEIVQVLAPEWLEVPWVDLASVEAGRFVPAAIARACGVPIAGDDARAVERLGSALGRRRVLVVLDNCEHVAADVAAALAVIFPAAPNVRVLATGRKPLGLSRERVHRIEPLAVPGLGWSGTPDDAHRYGAVQLFCERVRALLPEFVLDERSAPIAVAICRHLDGIPLALELAANRVRHFGLAELESRLRDRFGVLTFGRRGARARHLTLQSLIDWSYGLLDARECAAFRALAVFSGGFTSDAAHAMCAPFASDATETDDLVRRLVEAALLVVHGDGVTRRFTMLETLRAYALERLTQCGEREAAECRRAVWIAAFAVDVDTAYGRSSREKWAPRALAELGNARGALTWTLAEENGSELAAQIAGHFASSWWEAGLLSEGRRWIERVRAARAGCEPLTIDGQLLLALSFLSLGRQAEAAARAALALFARRNMPAKVATCYARLAIGLHQQNNGVAAPRRVDARRASVRACALFERVGFSQTFHYANAIGWLASIALSEGRFEEARPLFERSIAIADSFRDDARAAVQRLNLAELEFASGHVRTAVELVERVIRVLHAGGDVGAEAAACANAAGYLLVWGDPERALARAREAVALSLRAQHPVLTAIALQHVATAHALAGDAQRAVRLKRFVDRIYDVERTERESTESRTYAILVEALRARVDPATLAALEAEDFERCFDQAVVEAGGERYRFHVRDLIER